MRLDFGQSPLVEFTTVCLLLIGITCAKQIKKESVLPPADTATIRAGAPVHSGDIDLSYLIAPKMAPS